MLKSTRYRSSIFVFILEVIVFIVSMVFIMFGPTNEHVAVKKRVPGMTDTEASPLLPHSDVDDDEDSFDRRSPSIGYDSLVNIDYIDLDS